MAARSHFTNGIAIISLKAHRDRKLSLEPVRTLAGDRKSVLRGHDDGRDRWLVATARAAPGLSRSVGGYSWWSEETRSFTTRRELASTAGVFLINLGPAIEIVDASGETHLLGAGDGFVGGAAKATSLSRSTGSMQGVHVHVPLAELSRLAGRPMAELANRVVRLDDLSGAAGRELGARLTEADTLDKRWALLDAFLERRFANSDQCDGVLAFLLTHFSKGGRVEGAARELGWSRKLVARRFREATGFLPREFAALARFERFTHLLQTSPEMSLAEGAIAAGYADQPHLTRAVGRFANTTPGELRARLLPAGGGVRE